MGRDMTDACYLIFKAKFFSERFALTNLKRVGKKEQIMSLLQKFMFCLIDNLCLGFLLA
jgi:hypothetical protein